MVVVADCPQLPAAPGAAAAGRLFLALCFPGASRRPLRRRHAPHRGARLAQATAETARGSPYAAPRGAGVGAAQRPSLGAARADRPPRRPSTRHAQRPWRRTQWRRWRRRRSQPWRHFRWRGELGLRHVRRHRQLRVETTLPQLRGLRPCGARMRRREFWARSERREQREPWWPRAA